MISFRNIKVIFKKEFTQIMRDKSVLFSNFFIPLFGLPLYLICVAELANVVVQKEQIKIKDNSIFQVSIQGNISKELTTTLKKDKKIELTTSNTTLSEKEIKDFTHDYQLYTEAMKEDKLISKKIKHSPEDLAKEKEALLKIQQKYLSSLNRLRENKSNKNDLHIAFYRQKDKKQFIYYFHSEDSTTSRAALKYVSSIINNYESDLIRRYKQEHNISPVMLDPIESQSINIEKDSNKFITMMGQVLAIGIVFLLLISSFNPAVNTTIGERDAQTYKILLMNPIDPKEIFIGKYLNVAFMAILSLVPYAIEIIIFYCWGDSRSLFFETLPLNFAKIILLMFGTFSISLLISSVCFLSCSFSKTRVQAQSLISGLIIAILLPLFATISLDIKFDFITLFIPFANFALATQELFRVETEYLLVILSILVNIIASLTFVYFSLEAFLIQWKGKSDTKGLSDLLVFKRRITSKLVPAHAGMAFTIVFIGYVYGSSLISVLNINLITFLFFPLIFNLGTTALVFNYSKIDYSKAITWGMKDPKYVLRLLGGAFLLSIMFQFIFKGIILPNNLNIEFPKLFGTGTVLTSLSYFLIFVLIPGITEEILFRGLIYKALRGQFGIRASTIISSLMFAIIHLSLFRWGHTFILGIFLAYIYEKKGLRFCILFHMFFNAFGVFFSLNPSFQSLLFPMHNFQKLIFIAVALVIVTKLLREKKNEVFEALVS